MKRKNLIIMAVLIMAALGLRIAGIFTIVEPKTGFYNHGYDLWGTVLTIVVFALCFIAAIFSRNTFVVAKAENGIITLITSFLLALMILFEVFTESFAVEGMEWQANLMKVLGILSAIYFFVVAFSKSLKLVIPDLLHIIPSLYMIIRIICSFINIASLSLIAENVFYIGGLCCELLFFVSYAGFKCLDDWKGKSLNFRAILAASICLVTSVSNIVAEICLKEGYSHIPLYSQLVMLASGLFIGGFILSGVLKSNKE